MSKELLIIFVKNIKYGKVKSRLAKVIGDEGAFQIYKSLVEITEEATIDMVVERRIYYSDIIIHSKWKNDYKAVQAGDDLGDRMHDAFKKGFEDGYEKIVLIGSDLPEISQKIIQNGLEELQNNECVLGPAEDGGYYLIGLSKMNNFIFKNKPWSQPKLLDITLQELNRYGQKYSLLEILNDIDTFNDLERSSFYKDSDYIQELIKNKID